MTMLHWPVYGEKLHHKIKKLQHIMICFSTVTNYDSTSIVYSKLPVFLMLKELVIYEIRSYFTTHCAKKISRCMYGI